MRPVLKSAFQRVLDQQPPQARAVDEQIAFDPVAPVQGHGRDEAGLRMLVDRLDAPFGAPHAAALAELSQEAGIEAGVEMVGIAERGGQRPGVLARPGEFAGHGHGRRQRGLRIGTGLAGQPQLDPAVEEHRPVAGVAVSTEGMEVAAAIAVPVDEFDAELERRLGMPDQVGLVDTGQVVEPVDRRNGRFADADGADLVRFDELDIELMGDIDLGERRDGHPAGGAAADDNDFANGPAGHFYLSQKKQMAADTMCIRHHCLHESQTAES